MHKVIVIRVFNGRWHNGRWHNGSNQVTFGHGCASKRLSSNALHNYQDRYVEITWLDITTSIACNE